MADKKILLIEDNQDLSAIMRNYFIKDGYAVYQAYDGVSAVEKAAEIQPDVIVLDLMLPLKDGAEVCREIRKDSSTPIIVASAKGAESDKLQMLGIGADDYITKPFSLKELVARVNALLRRSTVFANAPKRERKYGRLTIYARSMSAKVDGVAIALSAKEFKLLDYLTKNKNQIFSKTQLMEAVWGFNEDIDEKTVTVCIARLREKLAQYDIHNIVTVWGVGYKWQEKK